MLPKLFCAFLYSEKEFNKRLGHIENGAFTGGYPRSDICRNHVLAVLIRSEQSESPKTEVVDIVGIYYIC
jgi:hypothetical protein